MLVPGSGRGAGRLKGFPSKAPFLTHRSRKHVPPPPPLLFQGERGGEGLAGPQCAPGSRPPTRGNKSYIEHSRRHALIRLPCSRESAQENTMRSASREGRVRRPGREAAPPSRHHAPFTPPLHKASETAYRGHCRDVPRAGPRPALPRGGGGGRGWVKNVWPAVRSLGHPRSSPHVKPELTTHRVLPPLPGQRLQRHRAPRGRQHE